MSEGFGIAFKAAAPQKMRGGVLGRPEFLPAVETVTRLP